MRVAQAIRLDQQSRQQLERQARKRSVAVRVAVRSRIVLLAADGLQNKQIGQQLNISTRMAALWRNRFMQAGVVGLLKDAPRPGRRPLISSSVVDTVIAKTTQTNPANATHWSTRTMAAEVGISEASVRRIWRAHGLKPHRIESFKISNDPNFAEKLEAIVGLYLNPPAHALVLSVDEKSQIQALDRTQPSLPMKKGRGQTMTHDYKRNGTTTLFADTNGRTITAKIKLWLQDNPGMLADNFGVKAYHALLSYAAAVVGNSSSGIIEAPSFEPSDICCSTA